MQTCQSLAPIPTRGTPPTRRRVMTRTSSSRKTDFNASASLEALDNNEVELRPGTFEGFTSFRGHKIRYQRAHGPSTSSPSSPTVLLVHGFGGNCDHFRKNIDELAQRDGGNRVYAIDLLGYGYSDKPDPRQAETNAIYNFDTWSDQILEFADAVAPGEKVLICTNSVGGIAGLEASIKRPDKVASVMLMNVSLRMLHEKKQSAFAKPFVAALQKTLRTTDLGPWFFSQIATTKGVGNVLRQCYHDASAVTDELVDYILRPGLEPNAVRVFLDFISYSGYVVFFLSSSSSLVPRTLVLTRSHSFSLVLSRSLSYQRTPPGARCPKSSSRNVRSPWKSSGAGTIRGRRSNGEESSPRTPASKGRWSSSTPATARRTKRRRWSTRSLPNGSPATREVSVSIFFAHIRFDLISVFPTTRLRRDDPTRRVHATARRAERPHPPSLSDPTQSDPTRLAATAIRERREQSRCRSDTAGDASPIPPPPTPPFQFDLSPCSCLTVCTHPRA